MVDPAVLARTPLFAALPADVVAGVAAASRARQLQRRDVLFREGDPALELFIVQKGRIAISNRSIDGRESLVALMTAGDLFGEMSLFDGLGRSAEARALERSQVVVVPFEPVQAALRDEAHALWKVVELLAARLRAADEALADTAFLDVTGRTAKRLLELAGASDEFQLPITQEELAAMVGASRERVNKAISAFIRLGWVEQNDRRYRIVDRVQLTRRAQ